MHKGERESALSERTIRHNFTVKSALIGSDFFHLRKIFNDQRSRRNFDESSSGPRHKWPAKSRYLLFTSYVRLENRQKVFCKFSSSRILFLDFHNAMWRWRSVWNRVTHFMNISNEPDFQPFLCWILEFWWNMLGSAADASIISPVAWAICRLGCCTLAKFALDFHDLFNLRPSCLDQL